MFAHPADGKFTRIVVLKGAFSFIADDGSKVTFTAYGEAADSMDKAITKAQSVAFRTALFQQFVVPYMAIDPEADGEDAEDEFQAIYNGVASQETDEDALGYWKKHVKAFKPNTAPYTKFRRLIEERRTALKGAA